MPWNTTRSAHTMHPFRSWVLWSFLEAGPAPWTPTSLSLVGAFDGARGIRCLAESPHLRDIRELNLLNAGVDTESLQVLVSSKFLGALEVLRLDSNPLGNAGMQVLAAAPNLASLRVLEVAFCEIGDVGVSALAASPYLRSLRELDLHANPFTSMGVQALAMSPNLSTMESLNLGHTGSPVGRQRLFFSTHFPYLCPPGKLTEDGILALAASPYLTNLRTLSLSYQNIGWEGRMGLMKSPNLPSLKHIRLHGVPRDTYADPDAFWASPFWAKIRIDSSFAPALRLSIQQQPQAAWETQNDPRWRLFAYACLTLEQQDAQTMAFLELAEQVFQASQSVGWLWCERHLLTWSGERLCLASERFPQSEALQQKRSEEAAREAWWGTALEEALYSE